MHQDKKASMRDLSLIDISPKVGGVSIRAISHIGCAAYSGCLFSLTLTSEHTSRTESSFSQSL